MGNQITITPCDCDKCKAGHGWGIKFSSPVDHITTSGGLWSADTKTEPQKTIKNTKEEWAVTEKILCDTPYSAIYQTPFSLMLTNALIAAKVKFLMSLDDYDEELWHELEKYVKGILLDEG